METTELLVSEQKSLKRKRKKSDLSFFTGIIVTGFGVGLLPLAPGTWGSLLSVFLVAALHALAPPFEFAIRCALILLLAAAALALSGQWALRQGDPDPRSVVIDEIVGQMLCLIFVPVTWFSLILGFLLFRFFDLTKPFPARLSERLPGSFGIVADDLIAGVYAGVALLIVT